MSARTSFLVSLPLMVIIAASLLYGLRREASAPAAAAITAAAP